MIGTVRKKFTHTECVTSVDILLNATKVGFTLAEVLVTLGIIGIVAAMTIPSLINNIRDMQFRSQFFKSYSLIKQTLKKMEADGISLYATSYKNGEDFLVNDFKKYHSNSISCNSSRGGKNSSLCYDITKDGYYAFIGNSKFSKYYLDDGQIAMPDGTLIFFEQPENISVACTWIFVDVNGKKLPNRLGHDLFAFQLTDDELKPMGAPDTSYDEETYCNKLNSGAMNGIGCAEKVVKNTDYFKWIKQ